MRQSLLRKTIAGLAFLFIALTTLMAQVTSRGTVTGTVTDPSGAVVPNATVILTEPATNVSRRTTTNTSGIYRFDAVDLGTYTVEVQAAGFTTLRKSGLEVQAARQLDVDFALNVGGSSQVVNVEASAAEVSLQTSEQVRSEHISTRAVTNLPLIGLDSLTLAMTAPGVVVTPNNTINQNGTLVFTVNGQRPRGNNFLIDGVENNDISVTGPAYTITNPDAVEEVNVQTSNFTAEFGRAGGGIINQVTKSGTNSVHGTAAYAYSGDVFKALNYNQKIAGLTRPPRDVHNTPWFSIGGPVVLPHLYDGRSKTFFFAAAQWDRDFGKATTNIRIPTDNGVALLTSLAASCPNVALYLKGLGSVRGASSLSNISIAAPSATGTCNGSARTGQSVETGLFARIASAAVPDNNHQIRIDHIASDKQSLSFRWLYDYNTSDPGFNTNGNVGVLPGFDNTFVGRTLGGTFSDTYTFSPTATNEFRFNYGRIGFNFPSAAPDAFHNSLQNYSIAGIAGFGVATNIPQFRYANNWQYADSVTLVRGKHSFKFGADFLRQLAKQHPPFNERGSLTYQSSTGTGAATAFANFIDDFGGSSGSLNRLFGNSVYYPNLLRQSYFFQDSWKVTTDLTLNLGLRYENYGTPANIFNIAAFTNYDPVNFATPHKIDGDNNNFAPTVGFAWSPSNSLFGEHKTVIRGGFQTTYDSQFNNLLSNIAGSTPNAIGGTITSSTTTGLTRGTPNFSGLFPTILPTPLTKATAQQNLFPKNFVNPYTDRWSLGVQRELPAALILDVSYVGSISKKQYRTIDVNPVVNAATGDRLHPELQITAPTSPANIAIRTGEGIRTIRASSANGNYNGLQTEVRRNFSSTPLGNFLLSANYTYGHSLDEISDVFNQQSNASSFESVSEVLGVSPRIDYASSDYDFRHSGVISWVWDLRGPKTGVLGQILGGWTLAGIERFESGFPYTVHNGSDRNKDGQAAPDRPDISNPLAPINTRAVISSSCATGYANPDAGNACVAASSVYFIEGIGLPNANTVHRNTLRSKGLDRLDVNIRKLFPITERFKLQYGVEMLNAMNTVNLVGVPNRTVSTSSAGTFLDVTQLNSVGRSMRMSLKLEW